VAAEVAAMAVDQAAMALAAALLLLLWQQNMATSCVCLLVAEVVVEQELQEVAVAELQVPVTLAEKYLIPECWWDSLD
jgi:hypothetical protein